MKTPRISTTVLRLAFTIATLASGSVFAGPAPAKKKVLYFTKSSGYEHSVVKRNDGAPSWSERVLAELGPAHGIEFTFSKDGSLFSPAYFAQFDAIMFYTSGDLLAPGTDGQPPMTLAGKQALLDAVSAGKGFIGIHAASDSFHTGETVATKTAQPRTWRYRHGGETADPYIRLMGAEFIVHGVQQHAVATVVDPAFPGFGALGPSLALHEEWYSLTDFSTDLHVLLVLETDAMRDPKADPAAPLTTDYLPYQRPPFPITWARAHGAGRVFYTALGHREDVWTNPAFQQLLFGGLAWATRQVEADVTPNIRAVTPDAWKLPPIPTAK